MVPPRHSGKSAMSKNLFRRDLDRITGCKYVYVVEKYQTFANVVNESYCVFLHKTSRVRIGKAQNWPGRQTEL